MPYHGLVGAKYITPMPKGTRAGQLKRRKDAKDDRNFCDFDLVQLPSPTMIATLNGPIDVISPEVSKAKVTPTRPSFDPYSLFPYPQTPSTLEALKKKSGIFMNVTDDDDEELYLDGLKLGTKEKVKRRKRKKEVPPTNEDVAIIMQNDDLEQELRNEMYQFAEDEYDEGYDYFEEINVSTQVSNDLKIRMIRKDTLGSVYSMATSVNEKELKLYEDMSWAEIPVISKLVQTIRDQQMEKPRKKYKRGALESHSYTKLKQETQCDFCFKSTIGTIHQGDENFCKTSRNSQGICMPAAAFCYLKVSNPKKWKLNDIDEIVELGNQLYLDSIAELHMHAGKRELAPKEIQKFVVIKDKKIKFDILDADVYGLMRSMDKKIYNLTKGLRIFFLKHRAGVLKAENLFTLIWRKANKFYFFDAAPRLKTLHQDPNGTALLGIVQDDVSLVSVFLERSNLFNSPFSLSQIKVVKMLGKDEPDEEIVDANDNYNMLNEKKAVVQASFDLADMCFLFTRSKQALCMSLIALTYSRITPPPSWHKKTLDKIMIIGNQLHVLCCEAEEVTEVELEHLPAIFTVGPYIFEVFIYANRFADTVLKKSVNRLEQCLKEFFETSNSALLKIGKSYVAVWAQRDMYFMFDPYTRNKEGFKCRVGAACVSMNSDIETMVETIMANFEHHETVFYLHALKVVKIHRDPDLLKLFPKHMPLHDVRMDLFKKHKVKKSKKKAIEKPITAFYTVHAMKKMVAGLPLVASITEIESQVGSIYPEYLPPMLFSKYKELQPKHRGIEFDGTADLDSPSLSDTQIDPPRPETVDFPTGEEISLQDLDSFVLTMEEQELQLGEGDEGYRRIGVEEGHEGDAGSDLDDSYYNMTVLTEVHSGSLDPAQMSEQINTDLSYCYKILPALELPKQMQNTHDPIIRRDIQWKEFDNRKAFVDTTGGVQILRGKRNILTYGIDEYEVNLIAPYACVMMTAYALELPMQKWDRKHIDFVIKAGIDLYNEHNEKFNKIEEYEFHFKRLDVHARVEIIFNTYLGADIFESSAGEELLEEYLLTHIFMKNDCGYLVTPTYSCAVLFKRSVYYLYDPYNNDKKGEAAGLDEKGNPCLLRFRSLNELTRRLINNKRKRDVGDGPCTEFLMFTLAMPVFTVLGDKGVVGDGFAMNVQPDVKLTQSQELAREHNFITLPDDSQLVRGTTEVGNYGAEIEFIAPFACIMAAPVAIKYSTRTWSTEVVDFVIKGGAELYKKSKFRYDQVAKLDIPKVSLGKTDFSVSVEYLFDAPMKQNVVESSLKSLLRKDGNWGLIVTQVYSCATYLKNELYYLLDVFPCNEVGLSDGPDFEGVACFARFKTLHDLVTRVMYNKNKRESPDKLEYTRFILSICRAMPLKPDEANMAQKRARGRTPVRAEALEAAEREEEEMAVQGGEDEIQVEPKKKTAAKKLDEEETHEAKNKVGFQLKGEHKLIEATLTLGLAGGVSDELLEDHFISLVATLMAINTPIETWDTKRTDKVFEMGKHIYAHADNLEVSKKRTIKNILIGLHLFDVIVRMITIPDWKKNKNLEMGLKYVMRKRKFVIVQFPNRSYVVYKNDDGVMLFSPYDWELPLKKKKRKAGDPKQKEGDEKQAAKPGWVRFKNEADIKECIKANTAEKCGTYYFYTFDVISVRKAPKAVILSNQLGEFHKIKPTKREVLGRPLHETESWVHLVEFPWGKVQAGDKTKCKLEHRWHNWTVEFEKDLYSLVGTVHQTNKRFEYRNRGKQTLANMVICIAMTNIYEFAEWNAAVINSVLVFGDQYFVKCTKRIRDNNYELSMDDLRADANISPYNFSVAYKPVVQGTMFLQHPKKFNLAKALRYFFDNFESRCGVIVCERKAMKRLLAFGKIRNAEYFMFDCQSIGPPMFPERQGSAYILRATTLNRLVHILAVTLSGGDFFIHEVETYDFKPEVVAVVEDAKDVKAQMNEEVEEEGMADAEEGG